jgi:hypothetical protein
MKSDLRATDIFSAVWPLYFISKIFGLSPYNLIENGDFEKLKIISFCLSQM